jgi:hypothetical protein
MVRRYAAGSLSLNVTPGAENLLKKRLAEWHAKGYESILDGPPDPDRPPLPFKAAPCTCTRPGFDDPGDDSV